MKKILFLFVALVALLELPAYQVVEVRNPVPGEGFTSGTTSGGKLVAVQVFSTNLTGTVRLKSVYQTGIYTNASSIVSASATNYVVVSSNRMASTSREVFVRVPDSSSVSTNIYTGAVLTNVTYRTVVTNVPAQVVFTNTFAAADFGPFTVARWNAGNPMDSLLSVSTNVTVTAATNSWRALKSVLAVTNTLVSGSCSTNIFSGSPASDVYLREHEWLVFEGTASGGWLRLILE